MLSLKYHPSYIDDQTLFIPNLHKITVYRYAYTTNVKDNHHHHFSCKYLGCSLRTTWKLINMQKNANRSSRPISKSNFFEILPEIPTCVIGNRGNTLPDSPYSMKLHKHLTVEEIPVQHNLLTYWEGVRGATTQNLSASSLAVQTSSSRNINLLEDLAKTSGPTMDTVPEVWHTQVEPEENVENRPECSICFTTYDNIFKTPKVLQCSHTFCLECVARLVASLPADSQHDKVMCPFCRQPTQIPQQGVPALQTSKEMLSNLPPHLQHEETVWIEGTKLCYKHEPQADSNQANPCICVEIGLTKKEEPPAPAPRSELYQICCGCSDWKRLLLIAFMVIILFCILLWPVQCILKTGNLRCTSETAPTKLPFSMLVTQGLDGH